MQRVEDSSGLERPSLLKKLKLEIQTDASQLAQVGRTDDRGSVHTPGEDGLRRKDVVEVDQLLHKHSDTVSETVLSSHQKTGGTPYGPALRQGQRRSLVMSHWFGERP